MSMPPVLPCPPRLLLAPMEGLLDDVMRAVISRAAGAQAYAYGVAEFARVTDNLLPHRAYRRIAPELSQGGRTESGLPIRIQLLGSDPAALARNAAHLAALVPPGIDLNFGCPAPTVNRHRGGAVLLDEPELLYRIACAVRAAVPQGIPFTAKMRLGVRDHSRARECAQALAAGGVEALTIHARTKLDGYRPPAHWAAIAAVAEGLGIPVTANGEVWCVEDWLRCRSESACSDVMLGRGALADPLLARRIHTAAAGGEAPPVAEAWPELLPVLGDFWRRVSAKLLARHRPGRLKQWLQLLERSYPQARRLLAEIRGLREAQAVECVLRQHGVPLGEAA